MKKLLSLLLVAVFTLSLCTAFTSCQTKKTYTIGICQLTQHDALDAATKGFQDALKEILGEENVKFDYQNAAGDGNACATIVTSFVSKKVDLILANATASLEAASAATTTIPILGTSITSYIEALKLKDFNGTVGGNISGTSDLAPLEEQAEMLVTLFPDAKKVGLIYCSAEPNSEYQIRVIKEILEKKGLTCTSYSFSDGNDVAAVTTSAADNSDVIYIPTDNTAASYAEIIGNILVPKKIPAITGEEGICRHCGVATLSISYYDLGRKTGEMAAKILKGEANISEMPIEYVTATKKYNERICKELGITIPEGYEKIGS